MLAEFEVRVVLHPTGHDPRVAFTGIDDTPEGFELGGLGQAKARLQPSPSGLHLCPQRAF
jgi:hypothetical protein